MELAHFRALKKRKNVSRKTVSRAVQLRKLHPTPHPTHPVDPIPKSGTAVEMVFSRKAGLLCPSRFAALTIVSLSLRSLILNIHTGSLAVCVSSFIIQEQRAAVFLPFSTTKRRRSGAFRIPVFYARGTAVYELPISLSLSLSFSLALACSLARSLSLALLLDCSRCTAVAVYT